jgi:hypothetical protein
MLSWIRGSSLRREAEEKNGDTAARRTRCFSYEVVPKMESKFAKAWDHVGGLSRLVCAPAKRTS